MSVLKNQTSVKDYNFGELNPAGEVMSSANEDFHFISLNDAENLKHELTPEKIRKERRHEAATSFEIFPVVKEHRGLQKQATDDYEKRVEEEVARRVENLKHQAVQEGYEHGLKEGHEKAYAEAKLEFEEKINHFVEQLNSIQTQVKDIYSSSKENAYLMVKNLSKWVILKEVDEKYYLARLLEKLIHEINSKANLVVHVNEEAFGYMPEIIKIVERKVGKLTNVRVETDFEMSENGIKLESENTVIDGSLDAQFKSIDKLFHSVGLNE
ncbi:MAG: FliH/SctL family protein [Bacteriovoracaceae bacterium]|nr:hypothetical protein [Halobacteriovoraceae bacterium]MDP7320743.1 FliH/SctL family protein [Bacteriovoracaceae bacterium]